MPQDWSNFGVDLLVGVTRPGGRRAGLERALREAVRDGRLTAGSRLPSTRALAAELGLSRGTVTGAYEQLTAEGYLIAARGSGTTVGTRAPARSPDPSPNTTPSAPRLDLRPGSPDLASFPAGMWMRATRRALASAPPEAMGYLEPQGLPALRVALAEYLGRTRGVAVTPAQIVVTSGSAQSLRLVADAVGANAVAMEDPGLPFHRGLIASTGRRVHPLPVDGEGALAGALDDQPLARCGLIVVTPAHQYPTGVSLTPERRRTLLAHARRQRSVVFEDDYDGEFRHDRQPTGALQGIAPDLVAYAGTTSKTLAPGLRLGWLVLPPALIEPVCAAKRYTDLHTSSLSQLALAEMITSHDYDRHVRAMRIRYRQRRDLLVHALQRRAGGDAHGLVPTSIEAGLQCVVRLPDEERVLARAARSGLALEGLRQHFHAPSNGQDGLVIGFAKPSDSAYRPALTLLGQSLGRARSRLRSGTGGTC